jgi:hypothetical protein
MTFHSLAAIKVVKDRKVAAPYAKVDWFLLKLLRGAIKPTHGCILLN